MKKTLLAVLLVSFMVLGPSCRLTDSNPASPAPGIDEPANTEIDLDSPTGGFSYSDEEPAFGEPGAYEPLVNESAVEDAFLEDEIVRNMMRRRGTRIFRFRAVWGRLANGYTNSTTADICPLDWSGTLHLEGGIIIIERIIAFEPDDGITRVDRSTIGWVSNTGPHIDGIQVILVIPPGQNADTAGNGMEPGLVLTTGPYSRSFTVEELKAFHSLKYVDSCGNGISINSHIIPPRCPRGHLLGVWRKIPHDTTDTDTTAAAVDTSGTEKRILGRYRGVWIGEHGHMAGYLKGVFGISSAAERVFFGKYVNLRGKFMGIIKGNYGPAPDLTADSYRPHGWFNGHWFNRDRMEKGRLKGNWCSDGAGRGYFNGVWAMNCSSDP